MFGNEYDIVREFNAYFLDYQEQYDADTRWTDRIISSSGDWSGNVYDFYFRVYNKLIQDIKVPFKMDGGTRIDDTPVHQALREALANCLVNADYYGNPRYFVGGLELASILGVSFSELKANQEHLCLTTYKGKKYGFGFVVTSYYLLDDLTFIKDRLNKILILEENFPDLPLRVKLGEIQLKASNRWTAYDDSENGYFANINNDLNLD